MGAGTLISVEEYLRTSYDPDMEYMDGVLEERNVGGRRHSRAQRRIVVALCRKYPGVHVWPELRSSTTETRFRLPDICVTLTDPGTEVLWEAAFLVIEILSEDDRMSRVMGRLQEFAVKGVPHIWLSDPALKTMSIYHGGNLQEVKDDVIASDNPRLELTRDEIFQE
jgi:Uma2 family endonuclease